MGKVKDFINRDLSWLSFNERVLQEAEDSTNPLIQRIRFLGIFSNNLDEFFRVRVATLRRMIALKKKSKDFLGAKSPEEVLEQIQLVNLKLQAKFQAIYEELIKELEKHNIYVINENQLSKEHGDFVKKYFRNNVSRNLVPLMLQFSDKFPALRDRSIYFAIKLSNKNGSGDVQYSLLEVGAEELSRFIVLPSEGKKKYIILLDDVIRYCIDEIFIFFDYDLIEAFTVKITRDAELDIDDDISKSFIEKMSKSLEQRKRGAPVRMVYDREMPIDLLEFIKSKLKFDEQDRMVPGGRYHNFKDFLAFPTIGPAKLENKVIPPIPYKYFKPHQSIMKVIEERDVMLHFPYQSFDYLIDFLREAAVNPGVKSIQVTLYRVAKRSKVINSLINAVRNGKKVTVVIELLARFDEKANIKWSNRLQDEGIKVIHGVQGLKIHSKLALVTKKESGETKNYAFVGTGNFQEDTAKIYGDQGMLTCDERITGEVARIFNFFENNYKHFNYKHLIVSPYKTRSRFIRLIENEIENAEAGKKACIYIKLNSLVDRDLIEKLYEASQAGVKIKMIIRGICSLIAGVKGLSENIEAISIVDKYLEHSRVIIFHNNGDELYFISSADWMIRNLDNRIEVTSPVYDKEVQRELKRMLEIQFSDNVKARILDAELSNKYKVGKMKNKVRAQIDFPKYLKRRMSQLEE
jgi:polyphosphate kinase